MPLTTESALNREIDDFLEYGSASSSGDSREEMCEVLHPTSKIPYTVSKEALGKFLEKYGKQVQTHSKD